jgi:uncharacterized protein (DUF2147 family)
MKTTTKIILHATLIATAISSLVASAQPAAPAAAQASKAPAKNVAKAKASFQKLKGRWQRTDGGYIVEIRSVEAGGRLNAAYFNPRPINVAIAEASQDGGTMRVFIELHDVNYPGSTYHLSYESATDRLDGTYFQAAIKQTFNVSFLRVKP